MSLSVYSYSLHLLSTSSVDGLDDTLRRVNSFSTIAGKQIDHVVHVICTRLRPSHLSERVGDGSRRSVEIVKHLELRL